MKTKTIRPQALEVPFLIGSKARISLPVSEHLTGATVFVEPQDEQAYRQVHGARFQWQVLPKNDGGFGYLLNQQLHHAKQVGLPYYVFCDDDVFGFKTRAGKRADLNAFFRQGIAIMAQENYSQLMMSFSGHNWYHRKGDIKERIGAWCVVINRTDDLLAVGGYDEGLPIFNDWDMSAKLIRAGKKTACWYAFQFNHKMNSQRGGAEFLYRKQATLDAAILMLRQRYGEGAVRTVRGRTGLTEARFNWAKL